MNRAGVKLILAFCFVTTFSAATQAQNNCTFVTQTARVALDLRLGMTTLEARASIGKTPKISNKTKGDYRFFQNYIKDQPPPNLAGVRALYLRFFDGRLYQIEIFYNSTFAQSLENFAALVAQNYNFAPTDWIYEKNLAVIRCGENRLVADYVLNPRIELTNETLLKKVDDLNKSKK